MSTLTLTLLGDPSIMLNGAPPFPASAKKAAALVYYLAVTEKPQNRLRLATLLWGEVLEANARASLRKVVTTLRKSMGDYLIITDETIAFDVTSDYWLDVSQMEVAASILGRIDSNESATLTELIDAADIYRGDFLDGFYVRGAPVFEEWVISERTRLQRNVLELLSTLANLYEQRGQLDEAIRFSRRLLEIEPWREDTHQALMRLLALSGDRSAALAHYESCQRQLEEELGIEPSAQTKALYDAICRETLAPPISPIQSSLDSIKLNEPGFLMESSTEEFVADVIVARHMELAKLHHSLERTISGKGQVVFIRGEAGTGKTALATEFVQKAQERYPNLLVAKGNAIINIGHGDPYLPFRAVFDALAGNLEAQWAAGLATTSQAKRMWDATPVAVRALVNFGPDLLGRLIPFGPTIARARHFQTDSEIDIEPLVSRAEHEQASLQETSSELFLQQYFAVLHAITVEYPLVLILDDLQWADSASINLLFYLVRSLTNSRLMIVGAYRPDEIATGHRNRDSKVSDLNPLQKVLDEIKRMYGEIWIDLDESVSNAGVDFVQALLDAGSYTLDDQFRDSLTALTHGHPLFTVELLQSMQERGDLVQDKTGRWQVGQVLDWDALPARIEGVIEERISRLEDEMLETLEVASVEGEEFTAQVVAIVRETDERQLIRQLIRELEKRHHLVNDRGNQQVGRQWLYRFQFHHQLLQRYIYQHLGEIERHMLHQDVAYALESLHEDLSDDIAPILAWHFATANDAEKAIPYLLKAGDRARDLHAHEQAIAYYEHALRFLRELGDLKRAARTLMKLGLTHHIAFQFRRSQQAFDEGFTLWQEENRFFRNAQSSTVSETVRIGTFVPPASLDPTRAFDRASADVVCQLFCGLVTMTPDLDVVPDLARSWEVLQSGRAYIFHLRNDVIWSDGTPITSMDIKYAWMRVLDPSVRASGASLLFDIQGARGYHEGSSDTDDLVGVQCPDESTLIVELVQPTSYFLNLLAFSVTYPVPRHIVTELGDEWAEPDNLVCSGPFRAICWHREHSLLLSRNTSYHGPARGNIEEVKIIWTSNPDERMQLYQKDELDVLVLWGMTPNVLERARQRHADEYLSAPYLQTTFLAFDASRAPFDDLRVRQAFAHGIDRETLAHVVLQGTEFPARGSFTAPGLSGYLPDIGYAYCPERARTLLAEAGMENGAGLPAIKLVAPFGAEQMCEHLKDNWRRNLGVDVSWTYIEWQAFEDHLLQSDYHIFLIGWTADYPDADSFLRIASTVGDWGAKWDCPRFEECMSTARQVTAPDQRKQMYEMAERILIDQVPIVPLLHGRLHLLLKPWVSELPTSPMQFWFLKDTVVLERYCD